MFLNPATSDSICAHVTDQRVVEHCSRFHRTFSHHSEVDHLADNGVVLIVGVEEDAVEEAAVGARVVEGDVEQVYGRVLDVVAPLTSVPVHTVHKVVAFNGGAVLVVGVDLVPQTHQG